jgi:hypothetical protein
MAIPVQCLLACNRVELEDPPSFIDFGSVFQSPTGRELSKCAQNNRGLILSIAVGYRLHRLVEQPMLRVLDGGLRVSSKPRSMPVATAATWSAFTSRS